MGKSYRVEGIKPPDEKWRKMKSVYDACKAAGVEPPQEVWDFFGGDAPNALGVCVHLGFGDDSEKKHPAVSEFHNEGESGFAVDLTKLPKGIKFVRFIMSY